LKTTTHKWNDCDDEGEESEEESDDESPENTMHMPIGDEEALGVFVKKLAKRVNKYKAKLAARLQRKEYAKYVRALDVIAI